VESSSASGLASGVASSAHRKNDTRLGSMSSARTTRRQSSFASEPGRRGPEQCRERQHRGEHGHLAGVATPLHPIRVR
jgi:hypothetical protein